MYNHKLSDKLFDIISGNAYDEAILKELKSAGILTVDETNTLNAYLTGEAYNCTTGYFWFKAQDIVIKLNSLGLQSCIHCPKYYKDKNNT